jgi:hypothetical protein
MDQATAQTNSREQTAHKTSMGFQGSLAIKEPFAQHPDERKVETVKKQRSETV